MVDPMVACSTNGSGSQVNGRRVEQGKGGGRVY